jgi:hypothetical protein
MVQLNATTGVAKYEIQSRGESNDAFDVNEVIHDTYERTKKALRGLPQVLTRYNVVRIGEWASAPSPAQAETGQDSG